ncbi:MAG TPA: hypothetical protein VFO16_05705, partial [Pseudonocardiaceae bacterium]|nr:hypothetical protein [Pseudonocardiaceae bacterium]
TRRTPLMAIAATTPWAPARSIGRRGVVMSSRRLREFSTTQGYPGGLADKPAGNRCLSLVCGG